MRGHRLFNFPAFFAAEIRLRELGYDVVNPAARDMAAGIDPSRENTSTSFDIHAAFRYDFQAILDADAVVFLPGWMLSKGANAERVVAHFAGVRCFIYEEAGLRDMAPLEPDISWGDAVEEPIT